MFTKVTVTRQTKVIGSVCGQRRTFQLSWKNSAPEKKIRDRNAYRSFKNDVVKYCKIAPQGQSCDDTGRLLMKRIQKNVVFRQLVNTKPHAQQQAIWGKLGIVAVGSLFIGVCFGLWYGGYFDEPMVICTDCHRVMREICPAGDRTCHVCAATITTKDKAYACGEHGYGLLFRCQKCANIKINANHRQ